MITADQLKEKVQHQLEVRTEHLRVFRIIAEELEKWDGKKINKRIVEKIDERLDDYHVYYFDDKPFWKKITVRMIGDRNSDMSWEVTLDYTRTNPNGSFNFIEYLQRNSTDWILADIEKCTAFLSDNNETITMFLSSIVDFQKLIKEFHEKIGSNQYDLLTRLLDDQTRKIFTDTRFLV